MRHALWTTCFLFACQGSIVAPPNSEQPPDDNVVEGGTGAVTADVTPPTVSISAPGPLVTASSTELHAVADDDTGVATVSLVFNGGVPLALPAGSAHIAIVTPLTGLVHGSNTAVLTATDAAGHATSATATFTFDNGPSATAGSISTPANTPAPFALAGTDPDGDTLTFSVVTAPAHGVYAGGVYTPTDGYVGEDAFTFKANDGTLDSAAAMVAITVLPAILYVSMTGDDSKDGRSVANAKRTIQNAIDAADSLFNTVQVLPGTYDETLIITKPLTLKGPATLLPTSVPDNTTPMIAIGAPGNADALNESPNPVEQGPRVDIVSMTIDGSALSTLATAAPFQGVTFHPRSSGSVKSSHLAHIRVAGANLGVQAGLPIYAYAADVDVEDNVFDDYGKQAVSSRTDRKGATIYDIAEAASRSYTMNVRRNHIAGVNPVEAGTQLSQNAIVFWDQMNGEISGNTITDIGPAGPTNAAFGDAKVASDASIGFGIILVETMPHDIRPNIHDNTFARTQGVFVDCRLYSDHNCVVVNAAALGDAGVITGAAFLANANVYEGNRFLSPGPLDQTAQIYGQRDDDPNLINFALATTDCTNDCSMVLGAGDYVLTSDLLGATGPTFLLASAGTGAVTIDAPTCPSGAYSIDPSVTVTQAGGMSCP